MGLEVGRNLEDKVLDCEHRGIGGGSGR